jgi:hypothetical protein
MLRQLFISGVVAALQHGSIERTAVKRGLHRSRPFDERVRYIACSAFHQNLSQLNQVAL